MARAPWCNGYEVAREWVDRCLREDGSLFSEDPNRKLWTFENVTAFKERYDAAEQTPGSFIEQFERQLSGAPLDTIQYAAELLYVELLGESNSSRATKEERIGRILALNPGTDPLPERLATPLEGGVANYGAGVSKRNSFITVLSDVAASIKALDPAKWNSPGFSDT